MPDDKQITNQQNASGPSSPFPVVDARNDRQAHEYWNSFYSHTNVPLAPSQFAAFVVNEYPDHHLVIDVGCGNGRDTLFFRSMGYETVAIDASGEAIRSIQNRISQPTLNGLPNPMLINIGITDIANDPDERLEHLKSRKKLVYARFFLHAISEAQETDFIRFVAKICFHPDDILAVEFRTDKDANIAKIAPAHYRRFIRPETFKLKVYSLCGFRSTYEVEGTGFAKYKNEDAQVCRIVFALPRMPPKTICR